MGVSRRNSNGEGAFARTFYVSGFYQCLLGAYVHRQRNRGGGGSDSPPPQLACCFQSNGEWRRRGPLRGWRGEPPHAPSRCGGQDVAAAADSAAGSNHSRDCGDVCERPPLPDRHGHCFKEIARGPGTRGKEEEGRGGGLAQKSALPAPPAPIRGHPDFYP